MQSLKDTGIQLRTLQPNDEYSSLLENLNYNFLQIINAPGFKGLPGQSIVGPAGPSTRGSRWVFIDIPKFKIVYPTIQTADQINLLFINSEFASDPDKLFSSVYIPNDTEMILGDTIVLPSGSIIELVSIDHSVQFIDTGVTFSQIAQLTKEEVLQMIIDYLAGLAEENKTGFVHYRAEAKNANDTQPSLNTNYTQGSVVDIDVSNSGPGYLLNNYTIISPDELNVTEATKAMILAGSSKLYHKLIQGSQTELTNAYAPQVNTLPALAVLQNNYENGIIFGNQNESNFRNFGRLYRSTTSVILASSYSPTSTEYSEIALSNTTFNLRTHNATITANALTFTGNVVKSNQLNSVDRIVKLGINPALDTDSEFTTHPSYFTRKLILSATEGVEIRNAALENATILSMTGYKVTSTYKIMNVLNNSIYEVPTSALIFSRFANYDQQLLNINNEINNVKEHWFGERTYIRSGSVDLGTLHKFGSFAITKNVIVTGLPTITENTTATSIPAPAQVVTNDLFLNVFRVQKTSTTYAITQELLLPHPYNYSGIDISEQRFVKFIRRGELSITNNISSTVFGAWNRQLDGLDTIKSKNNAIEVLGSFQNNDLSIKHKSRPTTLVDQRLNTGTFKVIENIGFDEYGHVDEIKSVNLADTFVRKTDYPFDDMYEMYQHMVIFMAPFLQGGGMVLWNRPFNEIPTGWREVINWRGRLPLGYDPTDIDFNEVGKPGGKKTHTQTIAQMPKHRHNFVKLKEKVGNGGQNALSASDGTQHGTNTSEVGNNEAMPLMNPFRIVVFIELDN